MSKPWEEMTPQERVAQVAAIKKERATLLDSGYAIRDYHINSDEFIWRGKDNEKWECESPLTLNSGPVEFREYYAAMPIAYLAEHGKRIAT